jgi:hypothetical protein
MVLELSALPFKFENEAEDWLFEEAESLGYLKVFFHTTNSY